MIFTTGASVIIAKELPLTDQTAYATGQTSLHVTNGGVTKFYPCVVTDLVPNTTGTILTASSVDVTAEGLYVLRFVAEDNADLDAAGVAITTITTGTIRKVTDAGVSITL